VLRIGLISDTHGLLRPEAIAFLNGCDHIVHAGDIGSAQIIEQLGLIAPVTAVRGNNDKGAWAGRLAETELLRFESAGSKTAQARMSRPSRTQAATLIYAIHDIGRIDIDPPAAGVCVVVSGHSHRPLAEERNGVLYVNPGSAGPRRFRLPVSIGELLIDGPNIEPGLTVIG
jgi:uncharacterized protein